MTKILRLDVVPDDESLLAHEILEVGLILGAALAALLFLQRLS